MADKRPIGVFDSGLGGLTVARELLRALPCEKIVYFGDTSRVPYGNKSEATIKKYAAQDERFLLQHGVKMIIAACGTVSSVALDSRQDLPVPFVEVVSHAVSAAVAATENKKIGVIATAATINSGSHKRRILELMPDAEVFAVSCPLFVPLVEEGIIDKDDIILRETAKRYLEPLKEAGIDTLILGCTHYPVIRAVIADILEGVTLVNMGEATSFYVKDYLSEHGMLNDGTPDENEYYVSDKTEKFPALAAMLLGETSVPVSKADIEKV